MGYPWPLSAHGDPAAGDEHTFHLCVLDVTEGLDLMLSFVFELTASPSLYTYPAHVFFTGTEFAVMTVLFRMCCIQRTLVAYDVAG